MGWDPFGDVKRAVSGTLNGINQGVSGTLNSVNQGIDQGLSGTMNDFNRAATGSGNYINQSLAASFGPGFDLRGGGSSGGGAYGAGAAGAAQNPAFMGINQSEAFRRLQQQSKTKGLSPWAALANSKQNLMASEGIDEAAKRANSQLGQQMGNLAAMGGMTSGARERAISQAPQNFLNMSAEIGKQKSISGLDIAMEDAKRKQGLLEKVGGFEMRDVENRNAYNQNLYNQQMAAWAAKQQADATREAGKRDGLLGLF